MLPNNVLRQTYEHLISHVPQECPCVYRCAAFIIIGVNDLELKQRVPQVHYNERQN